MSDLGIEELTPGRYDGVVDKIEYSGKSDIQIIITYKIDTPTGVRRAERKGVDQRTAFIGQPLPHDKGTGAGKGHSQDQGTDTGRRRDQVTAGLLEGTALKVITRNERVAGFNTPIIVRVEKP